MKILYNKNDLKENESLIHEPGKSLALVPTMGALHEGHGSLIKKAKEENDLVMVSIFVNPLQFGPDEDYEAYPRDFERDVDFCERLGVDYIFHPDEEEMYPEGFATYVEPPEEMTNIMCGLSRPGHFRGVVTVLTKLFSLIRPNRAYFGEKDIQQLAIVRRLVEDLNLSPEIVACPIAREEDGLAKSSRNSYLNEEERIAARVLRRAILKGLDEYHEGQSKSDIIKKVISDEISKESLSRIDYIEILDFKTFERVDEIRDGDLIALAVYIGKTRLIDNSLVS